MTKQVRQAITPTHVLGSTGTAEGDNLGFRALSSFKEDLLGNDVIISKEQAVQGFIARASAPADLDPDLALAIAFDLIGAPVVGGFYAGVIDTIRGDIIAADAYQTGLRYALIVSPKGLEAGPGLRWFTSNTGDVAGAKTRWNGLDATDAVIAEGAGYEAHGHIVSVRSTNAPPSTPGGSTWYMPAMDELEILYRSFKPNTENNFTTAQDGRTFPGGGASGVVQGFNPSSDPQGFVYRNSPRRPDRSLLAAFQTGGAQALSQLAYWTTTWASTARAWYQIFTAPGAGGRQFADNKTSTAISVRPVRRVVF